jgi:hypothetical protein
MPNWSQCGGAISSPLMPQTHPKQPKPTPFSSPDLLASPANAGGLDPHVPPVKRFTTCAAHNTGQICTNIQIPTTISAQENGVCASHKERIRNVPTCLEVTRGTTAVMFAGNSGQCAIQQHPGGENDFSNCVDAVWEDTVCELGSSCRRAQPGMWQCAPLDSFFDAAFHKSSKNATIYALHSQCGRPPPK